ncbi:alanine--glyoxylate aminotransferase 2, mitochondrial-like [Ctenocephalides felis]|uniref:alanine--glyoxylate aminotransferase 2, mitochondrial-like n=1 Tax=Ctenocephalides felis TaxID=7515 RepID=UPI000E6E2A0C|nr:alanine--glyoxylate aminotransferase 2, mitochondrial-like [Ctenocephalides felis]
MPDYDFTPKPYKGRPYKEIVNIRKRKTLNSNTVYRKPLLLHQGSMQWVWDHECNRYLDMFAGVCTVNIGHCHPVMMAAAKCQLRMMVHCSTMYLEPKMHEFAEKLTARAPGNLKQCYILNTGAEAIEMALLMARLYTGRREVLSLRAGYHGMTPATRGLTAHVQFMYSEPARRATIHVMNPDPYQGLWGGSKCRDSICQVKGRSCKCPDKGECVATKKYIDQLKETIKYCVPCKGLAGMMMEPIQGVGGIILHTKGYAKKAAEVVRANGGLFMLDEIQTAFARNGKSFFLCEQLGVIPDILVVGKGICSGFPMSAVLTTPKIAECLGRAKNISTHAGNPFVTALASVNMDIIDKDCLMKNADEVGTHALKKLMELRDAFPNMIGDVRGKGLSLGIELVDTVKDKDGKDQKVPMCPNKVEDMQEEVKDEGVLIGVGGAYGNVFRIQPPLCIDKEDVDFTMQVFNKIFKKYNKKGREDEEGERKKCKN